MTVFMKQGFSPLEQYQRKGQGPWTDVYSLAATIYYCITGVIPLQALDRLDEDDLIPPRQLGAALTEQQEQALLYGMGVRSAQRFRSVRAFYASLYDGVPVPGTPIQSKADADSPDPDSDSGASQSDKKDADGKHLESAGDAASQDKDPGTKSAKAGKPAAIGAYLKSSIAGSLQVFRNRRLLLRMVIEMVLFLAAAVVLDVEHPIFLLGGTINISLEVMILCLFSMRWGLFPGIIACTAYSAICLYTMNGITWGPLSILLELFFAYGMVSLGGMCKGKVVPAVVISYLCYFVGRFIANGYPYPGETFWYKELFGVTYYDTWSYAFAVTGHLVLVEFLICLAVFFLLSLTPLKKFLTGEDLESFARKAAKPA